jgi:hypothetical protein
MTRVQQGGQQWQSVTLSWLQVTSTGSVSRVGACCEAADHCRNSGAVPAAVLVLSWQRSSNAWPYNPDLAKLLHHAAKAHHSNVEG